MKTTYKSTPESAALRIAVKTCQKAWAPPPRQTVSEWADAERRLLPNPLPGGQIYTRLARSMPAESWMRSVILRSSGGGDVVGAG